MPNVLRISSLFKVDTSAKMDGCEQISSTVRVVCDLGELAIQTSALVGEARTRDIIPMVELEQTATSAIVPACFQILATGIVCSALTVE